MFVKDVKPIGKVGKKFLENENVNEVIEKIIEKPLQKACKDCNKKNIETLMSSANKNNVATKKQRRVSKADVMRKIEKNDKIITLREVGRGYGWLLLNYNTLSDENREILFSLEKEYGEDTIWFVKSTYIYNLNNIRKRFKLKEIVEEKFNDKYAELFTEKQIPLMYNIRYPMRTVCIRMPIDEETTIEQVEIYFDKIISRLVRQ